MFIFRAYNTLQYFFTPTTLENRSSYDRQHNLQRVRLGNSLLDPRTLDPKFSVLGMAQAPVWNKSSGSCSSCCARARCVASISSSLGSSRLAVHLPSPLHMSPFFLPFSGGSSIWLGGGGGGGGFGISAGLGWWDGNRPLSVSWALHPRR